MNKYIITSPRFTGEIHVLYGSDNRLLCLDFIKCGLTDAQLEYFKNRCPITYTDEFMSAFGKSNLNVIQEGYEVNFEQWWNRYDLKHNKVRCLTMWNRLSEADRVNAFFKLGLYERHLSLNSWRKKAEPDTYLKDRYWDSEWK